MRNTVGEVKQKSKVQPGSRRDKAAEGRAQKACIRLAAVALAVLSLSIGGGSLFASAGVRKGEQDVRKYYTSVLVSYGDTLSAIAGERMCSQYDSLDSLIGEIKFMNHLTDDTIRAGGYLIVPYYEAAE